MFSGCRKVIRVPDTMRQSLSRGTYKIVTRWAVIGLDGRWKSVEVRKRIRKEVLREKETSR